MWQIYERRNTRALASRLTSNRTSPATSTVKDASPFRSAQGLASKSGGRCDQASPSARTLTGDRWWSSYPSSFGCGANRPDRSDRTIKWETRRLSDIAQLVLPHFLDYPLLSEKQQDVELLATISRRMLAGDHRTRNGLLDIARLSNLMNPSGLRRYSLAQIEASAR